MTNISIGYEYIPEHYVPDDTITITIHRKRSQDQDASELASIIFKAWEKHQKEKL
jgi:hypothetical protein